MSQQNRVLFICILASFVAFLDGSIVNVALPAIMKELHGGLVGQQWVVDAYALTLGSLMLAAGSLSDMFGRKKILTIGLIGFGVASILCAIAPVSIALILSRGLQGVFGALLVPSSLALIISTFSGKAQGRAIGRWTAWTGIAFVVGPLLGGVLVDVYSWRLIFAVNILPICVTLGLLYGMVDPHQPVREPVDVVGLVLGIIGLTGPVYALIEQAHYGWSNPTISGSLVLGIIALAVFVWHENHTTSPLLPPSLFKNRNFSFGNISTFCIYAGLALSSFVITIFLQQGLGYSAIMAGMATLPITIMLFIFSGRFGALAGIHGSRLFMTFGPLISAAGFLYMIFTHGLVQYWQQLFPGIILAGLGLAMTVAPLTSAVLGSIAGQKAGIASATNNAISRIAGLIAISSVGLITPSLVSLQGFHRLLITIVILLTAGGIISYIGIRNSAQSGLQ